MAKECLWYNGEMACYELLDFDPNKLTNKEIMKKAWEILKRKYILSNQDKRKALETLYLIDIDDLKKWNDMVNVINRSFINKKILEMFL